MFCQIFLKRIFLIKISFLVSTNSFAQEYQSSQANNDCLELEIEVLQEPYCQGSFPLGQLTVNVSAGSGNYSYEWLNANGGPIPPGLPQTTATTMNFLPANETFWVHVTDNVTNCEDSASYTFSEYSCQEDTASLTISEEFHINPVGYNEYSECELMLENFGCQLNFKVEFIISHENEDISEGDFTVKYYNEQSQWQSIPYTINSDGDALGFFGGVSGQAINCNQSFPRGVRVTFNQFNPQAPLGDYTANLKLCSFDANGDSCLEYIDDAFVSLTLTDTICNEFNH